jgi:hypothetical protein
MSTTQITNLVDSSVTLGTSTYPGPLTVTSTGSVTPDVYGATAVLNLTGTSPTVTIQGSLVGGIGMAAGINTAEGGNGGMGISLNTGTLTNSGSIAGGAGGYGGNTGFGGVGSAGNGGVGADLSFVTASNAGTIVGGTGGFGGVVITVGGDGVDISGGTLNNAGTISGGLAEGSLFSGGTGGTGLVETAGAIVSNSGNIQGGGPSNDFIDTSTTLGSGGGVGASVAWGTQLIDSGTVTGGSGGSSPGGGFGGIGIVISGGTLTMASGGSVTGGMGGSNFTNEFGGGSGGGAGGIGVSMNGGTATLAAGASVSGGSGGNSFTFGGAGGVGLYLNGGTFTTAGSIAGGAGGLTEEFNNGSDSGPGSSGDAVEFGPSQGMLVVEGHASFTGAIAGFGMGDTVDITNLTPSQLASDFNAATDTLQTHADGTLQFTGNFANQVFTFTADASGQGTDITLQFSNQISSFDGSTVTVGGPPYYPSPLTITSTGSVSPFSYGANAVVNAIDSAPTIINDGSIRGAVGSADNGDGPSGAGGIGISLASGGTVVSNGTIYGGTGGANSFDSTVAGNGGAGVSLDAATLTNSGQIGGGGGGYGGNGSGLNSGFASGGSGGTAAILVATTASNAGSIVGGAGGVGGFAGSAGGIGVDISGGTLTNTGVIRGGAAGVAVAASSSAGVGGIGVVESAGAVVTNLGSIQGGGSNYGFDFTSAASTGGVGATVASGTRLINYGAVTGGVGGFSEEGISGSGGTGVTITGGTVDLMQAGTISGGRGGSGMFSGGPGGVGVYLNGGTLTTAGTISGGDSGFVQNFDGGSPGNSTVESDSVMFGASPGTLIVDPDAVFNGAIGGFAQGDTIDITNLTPSQLASDFNAATDTLQTPADGTLQFTGNFANQVFTFTADASGQGTDITLQFSNQISSFDGSTVTVGGPPYYPSPLTITSTGSVTPSIYGATAIVNVGGTAATIVNEGRITGGVGSESFFGVGGGAGGTGVSLSSGGVLNNSGSISGGAGGAITQGTFGNNQSLYGGTGGTGVILTAASLTNTGTITGGAGGDNNSGSSEFRAGNGGMGAQLTGVSASNSGVIQGGNGGSGGFNQTNGGVGLEVSSGQFTNTATGTILGGSADASLFSSPIGAGGTGLVASYGAIVTNAGSIQGGGGGSEVSESYGSAPSGGLGASVSTGAQLTDSGTITGGSGGPADNGEPGAAGIGVLVNGGSVDLLQTGIIQGGQGGSSASSSAAGGGIGLELNSGSVTLAGSLLGGDGGLAFSPSPISPAFGGAGGTGLTLNGGSADLLLGGSISGGLGGGGSSTGGVGGTGVFLNGGTLTTDGSIAGGAGGVSEGNGGGSGFGYAAAGDAVDFGASPGTLIVDSSATFSGAIGGFAQGDTIDMTDLSAAQAASDFNSATHTLVTSANGTLTFAGAFSGEQFIFSADGSGGTDITVAESVTTSMTSTVTVGSGNASSVAIAQGVTIAPTTSGATGVIVNTPVAALTNAGSIYGGSGGIGVDLSAGTVTNLGSITGGGSVGNGSGGAGVYLDGGTLITAGAISGGGTGSALGDAVLFGSQASTLVVDPGATFNGHIVANAAVNDVLQLSGTVDPTFVGLGSVATGFSTLVFDPGASWTVEATTPAITALKSIEGFDSSDVIDLTDQTLVSGATATFSNDVLKITDGGASFSLNMDGTFSGEKFVLVADPSGTGMDIELQASCYRRGTLILTELGERRIEDLSVGDRVITVSGEPRAIRWIGRRRYSADAVAENPRLLPIRIRADALAHGIPRRDLWVSAEHAMFIDGYLIPASALVNGTSIDWDESEDEVTYLHVELDRHDVILAEGAPSESFADDFSRALFDNFEEYRTSHPQKPAKAACFCAPRIEDGDELECVRQRLATRTFAFARSSETWSMHA